MGAKVETTSIQTLKKEQETIGRAKTPEKEENG